MEVLNSTDDKMVCPYNQAHYIRKIRMNTHLIKCRKSYPDCKLVECEFNINHIIPEPELQYHHEHCSDRRKLEVVIYQEEGTVNDNFNVCNINPSEEESWDNVTTTSYEATKFCESNGVVRRLDTESAANRKNFRITERQRVSQVDNERPVLQHIENNRTTINVNLGPSRRNLPDRPAISVEEDTPELVSALMERVKIGKNKAYLAK